MRSPAYMRVSGVPGSFTIAGMSQSGAVARAAKFRKTTADVEELLDAIPNEQRRADARALVDLRSRSPTSRLRSGPRTSSAFGESRYRYPSGREGVVALAAFAPRKDSLVVYLVGGYQERHHRLLAQLGLHRTGKSCLYVKRLADVDVDVLRRLIQRSADIQRGMDRATRRSDPAG